MSVEKYQTYLYHVDFVDEEDNILLDTRVKIVKIDGKIVVYYIPNNAKSYVPDVRVFTIEEFVGE